MQEFFPRFTCALSPIEVFFPQKFFFPLREIDILFLCFLQGRSLIFPFRYTPPSEYNTSLFLFVPSPTEVLNWSFIYVYHGTTLLRFFIP